MKSKISICMEEEVIKRLKDYISEGSFRNRSHIIEVAVNRFMKEKKE